MEIERLSGLVGFASPPDKVGQEIYHDNCKSGARCSLVYAPESVKSQRVSDVKYSGRFSQAEVFKKLAGWLNLIHCIEMNAWGTTV